MAVIRRSGDEMWTRSPSAETIRVCIEPRCATSPHQGDAEMGYVDPAVHRPGPVDKCITTSLRVDHPEGGRLGEHPVA